MMKMKILAISDSHMFNDQLVRITSKYKGKVDSMIHCGDSSLPINDPLLKPFDIVVKGNHDDEPFPHFVCQNHILVTHGQYYHVYLGYDELIRLCHENQCQLCLHGHTHVPTYQKHENILFINPGSIMINRGSYGFGTYAIINIDKEIEVQFFNCETDEICDFHIIEEGFELLEEFKKLLK